MLRDPVESKHEYIKVPQGHLWIVGDNLAHSTDSRHYGPVPMGLVKGKVLATVYPSMTVKLHIVLRQLTDCQWFNKGTRDAYTSTIACGRASD